MIDRNAVHRLVDRVLDELDENENFVHLDIGTLNIGLRAQSGKFDCEKPYVINIDVNMESRFTIDDADLMIKKLDKLADTTCENGIRNAVETKNE